MKRFDLFELLEVPEFDYLFLLNKLKFYKNPRDKITQLIKNQEIIRVKKGIYVLGEKFKSDISMEVLGNMIYGPSYISKEWALSYYGLIPERVNVVTSMTLRKNKFFNTPLGGFSYEYIKEKYFGVGLVTKTFNNTQRNFLIAKKEKALFDRIYKENLESIKDIKEFLIDSLRIDKENLKKLDLQLIKELCEANHKKIFNYFFQYLKTLK